MSLKQLTLISVVMLSLLCTAYNLDWMQKCGICHCNWNSGKKVADCKNKQLAEIPRDLSSDLQVIDLSHNVIPELRREEFMLANLQNLHKIFLRNCTVQELSRDALKGLPILIELDLSHNFIKELHVGTFASVEKLRNLVMNNNQIEVLENYLFADLPFLLRVEFKNNRLKNIELYAFGHLPLLTYVYLEANQLTVLRKETFQRVPKLMHMSLADNPWNCTCELKEFRDFTVAKHLFTPPTNCQSPLHLKGKLWNEIPSENFACIPRILGKDRTYMEAQSDNITLQCRIEGSPRPNVTWLYNKRPINPNDSRLRILNSIEQYRADSANTLNSELRIYGVRNTDKGTYSCIAENRGGRDETEFQLLINGDHSSALDGMGGASSGGGSAGMGTVTYPASIGASSSQTQSNILLVICLIVIGMLLLLIVIMLIVCWYCRRVRTYQKDSTMLSENGLISSKLDKTHNSSMLEGSVIMEMQKGLLTEVNPVEKPPRRTELDNGEGLCGHSADDGHDMKKTLLDETQFGHHFMRDDETHSMARSDTTATPRSRHTYIDDSYVSNLPPDLLAFPASLPPTSPSMQSSHSNIPEQIIYGIRSPPLNSPVYTHMTPHNIYGVAANTAITAAPTNGGFMTLQHPKTRNLALIAAANSRQQQQSPFIPAPVLYSPVATAAVAMKQGYMTIPRKPRVPSWAPSSSATTTHPANLTDFQSPTSPNPSDSGTATTAELITEPVYDNLGLRTTAGGSSTLNLNKSHLTAEPATPIRYNMRDRPLPATPNLSTANCEQQYQQQLQQQLQQQQQQHQQPKSQQPQPQPQQLHRQQHQQLHQKLYNEGSNTPAPQSTSTTTPAAAAITTNKIYEPIQELVQQLNQKTAFMNIESLYAATPQHHSVANPVPNSSNTINHQQHHQPNTNSISNNCTNGNDNIAGNETVAVTTTETKLAKIPPRPPPKPKKKNSITALPTITTNNPNTSSNSNSSSSSSSNSTTTTTTSTTINCHDNTSQMFADEGEDGTEV